MFALLKVFIWGDFGNHELSERGDVVYAASQLLRAVQVHLCLIDQSQQNTHLNNHDVIAARK